MLEKFHGIYKDAPSLDSSNTAEGPKTGLPSNRIGEYPNCHRGVSIQQLTEADPQLNIMPHSGIPVKERKKGLLEQGIKILMGKSTQKTEPTVGTQEL